MPTFDIHMKLQIIMQFEFVVLLLTLKTCSRPQHGWGKALMMMIQTLKRHQCSASLEKSTDKKVNKNSPYTWSSNISRKKETKNANYHFMENIVRVLSKLDELSNQRMPIRNLKLSWKLTYILIAQRHSLLHVYSNNYFISFACLIIASTSKILSK